MQYQDILYEAKEGVATITINRPEKRNAVRPLTYEELTHAMHRAADDPEIGVVVLTGAGDKAFCSGGDVSDQATRPPAIGRPCQLLARYVGERKAREMVFGCRLYTAQQALEMGLINFVCKAEELDKV